MDPRDLSYAEELGVDFDRMELSETGLYHHDLEDGDGEPARGGRQVTVHYTGWLPDGSVFDTSRERGQPFSFTLRRGEVIPGWDEGVEGMREGGTRLLVIPAGLAYGQEGAGGGVIPPGATLVFEVELLEVH